jgi:hypothetical protein
MRLKTLSMNTNFLFPRFSLFLCLLLVFCSGCPQTAKKKPEAQKNPADSGETINQPPLVEPLVPKTDPPEKTEPSGVPAAGVPGVPAGKIAAETVPLPPVADLTGQADEYVAKLGVLLEDIDGSTKYKEDSSDIVRDSHALMLVALAIGLSDGDSKYKQSAPHIIAAAKTLATAENLEAGRNAYKVLTASLQEKKGGGQALNWTAKTADLTPLMKAVPNLSSMIKRLNTENKLKKQLEKKPAAVFGALAALTVIPQGSIANAAETSKPDAAAEWKKDCEHFRDAALKANGLAHQFAEGKAVFADFKAAVGAMQESCDQCHKVFHPAAMDSGKEE